MKQTAVEWLIEKHFGGIENCTPDFRKHIEQAKEIERKQQGYSEEELRKAFKIGHRCARQGSYNDITEQEDFNKWFEKIKNK